MLETFIQNIRSKLFNTPTNTLLSLALLFLLFKACAALLDWAIFSASFNSDALTCRENTGACWSFIQEKWRFIIFGRYPVSEQWRPITAIVTFGFLLALSYNPKRWTALHGVAWLAFIPGVAWLLMGGFGLPEVKSELWGGLPLTLILSSVGMLGAYPLGILLALGRQSKLPLLKSVSVLYIELIRGVPLITLLFMGAIIFPLFLPGGMNIDALLRAQVVIILFAAAYLAEVVRGGLQAIPRGQYEAADSLGLSKRQSLSLIILPQALRLVIPVTVNSFIELFKDTSLVLMVSLMDLMLTTKSATIDPQWQGFSTEAYVFTAGVYFICCYAMASYSRWLEKTYRQGLAS